MHLKPELFFNLKAFEHRTLFGQGEPVWAALAHLPFYLGSMLAQRSAGLYRDTHQHPALTDPTVRIERPSTVLIAPTAVIKPFTVIEGTVVIDDGAVVGPNAYIRGPAIIGRCARVGHCSEIKQSVLFPGAKAPHRNSILDSLIGWYVNVGGHLVTPNLRADGRTVAVKMPHGRTDTGLKKLGIIAGDGCFFGCGIRFNPGDYFPPNTRLV